MDCSPPGSSVHGISQARILKWAAISFSRNICIYLLCSVLQKERKMNRNSQKQSLKGSWLGLEMRGPGGEWAFELCSIHILFYVPEMKLKRKQKHQMWKQNRNKWTYVCNKLITESQWEKCFSELLNTAIRLYFLTVTQYKDEKKCKGILASIQ